ncbi:MAG: hypothetical protein J3Q66DRAFT_77156 [Benniella sp.]|nr:MAG: hypothetical protein J3Q66DRAFT_77156 [Benniella sp.]
MLWCSLGIAFCLINPLILSCVTHQRLSVVWRPMLSFQRLERLHENQDPCGSVCGFLISGVLSLSSKLSLYSQ